MSYTPPGFARASDPEAAEMRLAAELEHAQREQRAREARGHDRVELQVAVTGVGDDNFFVGFSENISEGGVYVATMCPPAVGEVIELSIALGPTNVIQVRGECRWHRTNEIGEAIGCGVRFSALGPREEAMLQAAMERSERSPLFFDM